ncbi:MAG TPA: O-antigen ligase family protein [Clostridia bacterium]|nr:O-antigen ligase family protein [Clostridia bacterium]
MQTKSTDPANLKQPILPLREGKVLSWRYIAAFTLAATIVLEVLFNLLPVDHDTLQLFWFFPAALLAASQLYFNLRVTRYVEIKLLLAFLVWGCVIIVLNYGRAQLVDSYEWFAATFTAIALCFALPYALEREGAKRVLLMLCAVTLIAAVLLSIASLIAVFFKDIAAKLPSIFEGIVIGDGRLNIDNHPNRSAPAPALGVILAGVLLAGVKKTWQRVLIVLLAVVCFVPLALTGSRTAILSAALAIGYEVALTLRNVLKGRIHTLLRVCISLSVAAVSMFAFYQASMLTAGVSNEIFARQQAQTVVQAAPEAMALPEATTLPEATPALPEATASAAEPAEEPGSDTVVTRDFSDADSFNGRTEIWSGVFRGLLENPKILLIGTGPTVASAVMSPYFPPNSPVGIFHNSLLGVLAAFGIPGLLLLLAFLIMSAVASIRVSFGKRVLQPLAVKLLPAVLLFTVAEGMMEDFLFALVTLNIVLVWFMIASGFVLRLSRPDEAQTEQKRE